MAEDGDCCVAVAVAEAAGIICSLRAADLAGSFRGNSFTPNHSRSWGAVGSTGGARRPLILPVPPARIAGQRSRKKMRLPEVKQLVLSLSAENAGLRQEMESLQRACTALSKENGRLEVVSLSMPLAGVPGSTAAALSTIIHEAWYKAGAFVLVKQAEEDPTRLEHSSSSSKRKRIRSEEEERRQTKPQKADGGFVLPDLNIPAQDVADAPAAVP
uniref:BZIP domain-containing protein n=1 Tax=Aegilops tauschii TaxID=37682 RepID=R7W2U5_AEGTA